MLGVNGEPLCSAAAMIMILVLREVVHEFSTFISLLCDKLFNASICDNGAVVR